MSGTSTRLPLASVASAQPQSYAGARIVALMVLVNRRYRAKIVARYQNILAVTLLSALESFPLLYFHEFVCYVRTTRPTIAYMVRSLISPVLYPDLLYDAAHSLTTHAFFLGVPALISGFPCRFHSTENQKPGSYLTEHKNAVSSQRAVGAHYRPIAVSHPPHVSSLQVAISLAGKEVPHGSISSLSYLVAVSALSPACSLPHPTADLGISMLGHVICLKNLRFAGSRGLRATIFITAPTASFSFIPWNGLPKPTISTAFDVRQYSSYLVKLLKDSGIYKGLPLLYQLYLSRYFIYLAALGEGEHLHPTLSSQRE